jgi:hypothetical protein
MVEPIGGVGNFKPQGLGNKSYNRRERANHDEIKKRQNQSGLKIADLVPEDFPIFPKFLEQVHCFNPFSRAKSIQLSEACAIRFCVIRSFPDMSARKPRRSLWTSVTCRPEVNLVKPIPNFNTNHLSLPMFLAIPRNLDPRTMSTCACTK